jgi:hypothetical protein
MRLGKWTTLLVLVSTASCSGEPSPVDVAANDCRAAGGVPHGSSLEDLVCVRADAVTERQVFGAVTLDTDQSPLCAATLSGPAGCVIVASTIEVSGRLRATGDRSLILVADEIVVTASGVIDVAAHVSDAAPAAGAGAPECEEELEPPIIGHDCGAGGSFGGVGGNNVSPQTICRAEPAAAPAALRGGCSGRAGGVRGGNNGAGGGGGGAVLLIARAVTLDGVINASGAAGRGAGIPLRIGGNEGGGGGSGGMVAIDARSVAGRGVVMANGGGGGTGEGDSMAANPDGSDPDEASPTTRAAGGPAVTIDQIAGGGAGGAGASHDGLDGAPGQPILIDRSRGGGGGAVGVIRFYDRSFTTGTVSPAS